MADARLFTPDDAASCALMRALGKPVYASVPEMVREWSVKIPRAIAVETHQETYTYSDLETASQLLVEHLRALGINEGDSVGLVGDSCFGMIASLYALFKHGAIATPMGSMIPHGRRETVLEMGRARLLLDVGGTLPQKNSASHRRLHVDAETGKPMIGSDAPASDRGPIPRHRLETGGDPAYLFFTSGTTGQPRGVVGSSQSLAHFMSWQRDAFGHGAIRSAQFTQPSFDVFLRDVFFALVSGGTLCIPGGREALGVGTFAWLKTNRITHLHAVPTLTQRWLRALAAPVNLPVLESIFFAGEPLLSTFVHDFRALVGGTYGIVNLYGPTETTLAKFFHRVPADPVSGAQPVGFPLPHTEAYLLSEEGQLRLSGHGEILIRTAFPSVALLASAREGGGCFVPNPCRQDPEDRLYRTGDWGTIDDEGRLHIVRRIDAQTKINGVRLNPDEIASLLSKHPWVENCRVIARNDEAGSSGSVLVAYFVLRNDCVHRAGSPGDELRRFLGEQLPMAMVPAFFMPVADFPVNSNGKLDRAALPNPFDTPTSVRLADPSTTSDVVRRLVDIWVRFLPGTSVGADDNFFQLGGDSMAAVLILDELSRTFDVRCEFTDLLANPTILAFAAALPAMAARRGGRETKMPTLSSYPLSPQQRRFHRVYVAEGNRSWSNMLLKLPLPEPLGLSDVEEFLTNVYARHDGLRARFIVDGGVLAQSFEAPTPVNVEDLILSAGNSDLRSRLREFNSQGFDIEKAPLFRALVVKAPEGSTLFLNFHHLVFDGFSLALLKAELNAMMEARIHEHEPSLVPLLSSYRAFLLQQHERRTDKGWVAGQRRFWLDMLAGATLPFRLSSAGSRDGDATGAAFTRILDPVLVDRVRAVAQRFGTTVFVVYLSAFLAALGQVFARTEAMVSVPYAGRDNSTNLSLIGNFISIITLRVALGSTRATRDFVGLVSKVLADCIKNHDYQFDQVLDDLGAPVDPAIMPLTTVLFNTDVSSEPLEYSGNSGCRSEMDVEVRYELMGIIRTSPSGTALVLQYRPALLDHVLVERLGRAFVEWMRSIV